jgi:hypothetical protein
MAEDTGPAKFADALQVNAAHVESNGKVALLTGITGKFFVITPLG